MKRGAKGPPGGSEIRKLDVAGLTTGFRDGRLSPVEAIEALLGEAGRLQADINAFTLLDHEGARTAAAASQKRWAKGEPLSPLDGVPFTVKDNIIWSGHPARRGSITSSDAKATEDAPVVARLIEAGAIPFAKTTLPEFGWKGLGDSPFHGISRNPWDTRMTTGGSSAGAAAAAALGIGPLHIGTDGAGSIRIPASFCGVFGIKPSFGRVPAYPPSPFAIVSHVGPITRTVTDAAAMLTTIAAPDARDMTALVTPAQNFLAAIEIGVRGLRIAWSPRLGYVEGLDPEVEALCRNAVGVFEELGAHVDEADPGFSDPADTLRVLWRTGAWSILRALPESDWDKIDPGFRAEGELGREIVGADFVAAANGRGAIYGAMARLHQRFDLLVTPTIAIPAFEGGHDTPPDGRYGTDWLNWTPYSYPFNLTLQPAATLPCGFTKAGLPVGLQIVGPMLRDGLVLRAARAFEQARPWDMIAEPRVRHEMTERSI